MDFAFTPEEEAFRSELRAFLDDELPAWWRGMFVDDDRVMPMTRAICRKLAEHGWLTMAWPPEFGGQGASVWTADGDARGDVGRTRSPGVRST